MTENQDRTGRITQAELARRLKVSRPSVSKAVKAGRITPDDEGLFDPVEAELQWLANTRPKAQGLASKGGNGSYSQARARKETALARMAELRLEEAMGNLVSREVVEFVVDDMAATSRRHFEELPQRLAPLVAPITDLGEVLRTIDDMVRDTLMNISQEIARKAEGIKLRLPGGT